MRHLAPWAGMIVGLLAIGGCASDFGSEPPDESDKINLVLTGLGFDPATAVVMDDSVIVEGDIRLWRSDIDAYLESFETRQKGYVCSAISGADGNQCGLSLDPLRTVLRPDSIRLTINPSVPADWRLAFRRAAAVWSTSYLAGTGTRIGFDAEGKHANTAWTVNVDGVASPLVAVSSYPAPWGTFLSPGTLINVSTFYPDMPQSQKDAIALHELGHTLGFHHPSQGPHLPGTAQWTNASAQCTATGGGTYDTVFCLGNNGRKFLSDDDILATQTLYPDEKLFDLTTWDNEFCTWRYPCGTGEGHCTTDAQCTGFLVCLDTTVSQNLYGAPSGGRVCGPPDTARNDGIDACPASGSTWRCSDADCPCGVGQADCDNDQECSSGLVCGIDNGPAVGHGLAYDVCKHPRPPGCAAFDPNNLSTSLCSPSCPCSLGEGDCDVDNDCIGGLVCGHDTGAAFGFSATWDFCIQPEVWGTL